MKFIRIFFLLILPVYFFSCKPQQKIPQYLENVNDTSGKGKVKIPDLKIQKGDELNIQIVSLSTQPDKSDVIYNQQPGTGTTPVGYLVDNNGDITHHRLGTIHAEGLTKKELANAIKKRLKEPVELLSDPTVIIRLTNFKVTVLGQVGREGEIKAPGERLTIFEAIGLAGGITDFGKKTNLKVIREVNGTRETGFLDLSSKEVFDSPYYYMMQNDMVFVETTNQKYKDAEQAKTIQKISFAFTLVTVAATIASIFIRN
ncbi:MAG TPA: polysaccharide biosynthesis/export family protein [Chitinophagaceae bacterium]|nr:polysaccharide biosynthesis/export family protein [Chitinophagaceae bacterium]